MHKALGPIPNTTKEKKPLEARCGICFRRMRQEDPQFETRLGYIASFRPVQSHRETLYPR
jgi:hypothetical protein